MDSSGYIALNRQAGLLKELETVAQNIANISTTGFRREGVIFSEYVVSAGTSSESLSMAHATGRILDQTQGALRQTNGSFDFAIEGDGYFLLDTPDGQRLTRAGAFTLSAEGLIVALDGAELLDAGGAPILIPVGVESVSLASDGTLAVDGEPIAQIGLWEPAEMQSIIRSAGTRLDPQDNIIPINGGRIIQGFLENSNVDAVAELSRMINVQRAYELGSTFLDREDERVRGAIRIMGQ